VGVYHCEPDYRPDPSEVAYLIEVPLHDLRSKGNTRHEIRTLAGRPVKVPFFKVGNEQVWGATAMILSEFLDVVERVEIQDR
jgi:hypothetical protein